MTRSRTVASGALAVALAVAVAATWSGRRASAQSSTPGQPKLALAGQNAWTPLGGTFVMRLQGTNIPAGSTVALTVHDPVQSRTAFDQSVSGGSLPATRDRDTVAYDTLVTDPATGDRLLALRTRFFDGGVYPLEVDLRSSTDESLSRFVTHVVIADLATDGGLAVGVPLDVAWVWPLTADPAYVAGAVPINRQTLTDLGPTGRLGRQAAQLATNPDVPLTLAPSAETLDAWDSLAVKFPELTAGAASVRMAAGRDQVLTGPFVPLDLPSILGNGLGGVVNDELGRGITTLERFFATHLDPSTALPGRLDTDSVRLLRNANVRQLIVEGNALTPVDEKFTPAHPYKMQAVPGDDSTSVTVIATDTGFEKFLTGDDPPALRAAHLLAGLALVAEEQPSLQRGVALVNPDHWDANDAFVRAMLVGLRGNPLLTPTTVAQLLASVPAATTDNEPDGAPVLRQLAPYQAPAPPVSLRAYQRAQQDQAAVENLVGAPDPRAQRGVRALAAVVSSAWATPDGRRLAGGLLNSIRGSVHNLLNQIEVQAGTITITSSSASVPISFRNNTGQPVTVHVKLQSDKLLFPNGAERDVTLPPSRSTTLRVAVETRSSGTSPLVMTVQTAGGLPIATKQIRIRSSFVSGVGVFLTVGAIVFLALWWGWDIRRRQKRGGHSRRRPRAIGATSGQPA